MKRLAVAAVGATALALLALGSLSCREEAAVREPTPFPTATPKWSDAMRECTDLAKEATQAKFGAEFSGRTKHFTEFERKVEEVGDPYGVRLLSWDGWFDKYYETLFSRSPREHPEAWQFYESQHEDCMRRKGLDPEDDPLGFLADEPSSEDRAIIECIAGLIIDVEAEYGEGSLGYTTAYRNFAWHRPTCEECGVDLVAYEDLYERVTGRSPFLNADAMAAFRARARDCPEE